MLHLWKDVVQSDVLLQEGFEAPEDGELLLVFAYRKVLSNDPMYPGVREQHIENFLNCLKSIFLENAGPGRAYSSQMSWSSI